MLNNSYILIKEKQEMIEQNKKWYFVLISGIKNEKKKSGVKDGTKKSVINKFFLFLCVCLCPCV